MATNNTTNAKETKMTLGAKAMLVLQTIRDTHDTTVMTSEEFASLCEAVGFYLRGGQSVEDTARLVIEEYWPLVR